MNLIATILIMLTHAATIKPTTVVDLRKVTVKITNPEQSSGGTGSVLESGMFGSLILTNKHVCQSIEKGWILIQNNKGYRINRFKMFDRHDLCIVETRANLGVSTKLAGKFPKIGDKSIVTGHPLLLPQTVTTGHFGDELKIEVVIDVRECTAEEEKETPMPCAFFGKAITEEYETQYTSNLIQPGNSGSAVFNEKGELSAVVFAGNSDLGFTFTVPMLYITYFISNNSEYPWVKPGQQSKTQSASSQEKIKKYLNFCNLNKTDVNCIKFKRDLMLR